MTTEGFEFVASEEPPHPVLEEWLEDVPALIAGLPLRLPAGMRLDLSRESLVELNAFVLARFPDKPSALADDELTRDLVIRLAAYLGEAWLSAGGGRWHYDTRPDSVFVGELVIYTPVIGVPICPRTTITASCSRRLDKAFEKVIDLLVARVAERQETDPSWRPWRIPTSGFTDTPPAPNPEHDAWVADMDRALGEFVASLPRSAQWDLSPASLDALEPVLLDRYPDLASWRAAPVEEQDGPLRYYGEVIRRTMGGHWEAFPGEPTDHDLYVGRRAVEVGTGQDSYSIAPYVSIEVLLDERQPGRLGEHFRT